MKVFSTDKITDIYVTQQMIEEASTITGLIIDGLIHTAILLVRKGEAKNGSAHQPITLELDAKGWELLSGRRPNAYKNPKEVRQIASKYGFDVHSRYNIVEVIIPADYTPAATDPENDTRIEVKVMEQFKGKMALLYGFIKSRSLKTSSLAIYRQEYMVGQLKSIMSKPTLKKYLDMLQDAGLITKTFKTLRSGARYCVYKAVPLAKAKKNEAKSEPKACKDEPVEATPEVVDSPIPADSTPDWI